MRPWQGAGGHAPSGDRLRRAGGRSLREMALRFIGIGAPKCATTWTYRVLKEHPSVHFEEKELNFWRPSRKGGKSLEWYRRVMRDDDPHVVAGEISPGYVRLPVEVIRAIRSGFPDVRLFLNVREPVSRIWSRAAHAVQDEGGDITTLGIAELGPYLLAEANIAMGDYAEILDRWLSVFDPEQLLISQFEDITREPAVYVRALAAHIGIEAEPLVSCAAFHSREARRTTRAMPEVYRRLLRQQYHDSLVALRDRYGIDYIGAPGARAGAEASGASGASGAELSP